MLGCSHFLRLPGDVWMEIQGGADGPFIFFVFVHLCVAQGRLGGIFSNLEQMWSQVKAWPQLLRPIKQILSHKCRTG